MREIDWGSLSTDDDRKRAPNIDKEPAGIGLLRNIGHAIVGGIEGADQGLSDTGANIAQFPFDIYSWATGKPAFQVPRANFRQYAPHSEMGQKSEKIAEIISSLAGSPALAAERGGSAFFGGNLLARLGLGATLGAAESENRKSGAAFGAGAPAAGKLIKFVKETPMTQRLAAKELEKARKLAGNEELGIPMSVDFLRNMEYQISSPHLKPSRMQINTLMGNAAKGDYQSYSALQSALGDISRELLYPQSQGKGISGMIGRIFNPPQSSAAERLTGRQIDEIRNKYVSEAMEHLAKTEKGKKIANLDIKGRERYRNYKKFLPYRNAAIASALAGIPGIGYLSHVLNHNPGG